MDLSRIRAPYRIPDFIELKLPEPNDRIDNPPLGRIGLYKLAFKAEVRLSLQPFVVELFCFYDFILCSIIPNSFHFIIDFIFFLFFDWDPIDYSLVLIFLCSQEAYW